MSRAGLVPSVLLIVATAACGASSPEDVETAAAVPVVTARVATGAVRAVIHATGTVTPAPGAELVVTAPDVARIAELPKAEGDRVAAGDLLVRFEIPATTANVAAATSALAQARARLDNARAARARAHDLFDRGVAARKEVEDADREQSDAEAGVSQADASLAAAKALVDRASRFATFDGVVVKRAHNVGDLVDGSNGDPILRVVDPRRLEVRAAIAVADIPRVTLGASARIAGSPGIADATLRVIAVPAAIDPGAATATARLAFVTTPRAATGTPVQVEIDAEGHRDVVVVPTAAIVREGEEAAVFVVHGTKAHRQAVELGLADDTRTEIRKGLAAGDTIVVDGQAGLPDNADVKVGAGAS